MEQYYMVEEILKTGRRAQSIAAMAWGLREKNMAISVWKRHLCKSLYSS